MPRTIELKDNEFAIVIRFMDNGKPQAVVTAYTSDERYATLRSITLDARNGFDNNSKAKTKEMYETPRTYFTNYSSMVGAIKQVSREIGLYYSNWCRAWYADSSIRSRTTVL